MLLHYGAALDLEGWGQHAIGRREVLGKEGFRLQKPKGGARLVGRGKRRGRRVVFERGQGDGAVYLVVRQHADRGGGWHTQPEAIGGLVALAVEEGRKAWEENRR